MFSIFRCNILYHKYIYNLDMMGNLYLKTISLSNIFRMFKIIKNLHHASPLPPPPQLEPAPPPPEPASLGFAIVSTCLEVPNMINTRVANNKLRNFIFRSFLQKKLPKNKQLDFTPTLIFLVILA